MHVFINDWIIEVEVTHYRKGRPAITWRAPEDCHEAEEDELEFKVLSIVPDGDSDPDYDWLPSGDDLWFLVLERMEDDD